MTARAASGPASNVAVMRTRDGLRLQTQALPPLPPDGMRFRMLRAAVCGTDRQIVRGDRPDAASVLGHEGVAEVAAVGAAVRGQSRFWAEGDRVVFNPVNPHDQDEILGHSYDGLFQRYFVASAGELARRALLVLAPAALAPELCVLAEPLGTVLYTHELVQRAAAPRSWLVIGAGPVGILHALHAARLPHAPRVRIVCNSEQRARWLVRRGIAAARDVVRWSPDDAAARDVAAGGAPDLVLACTPARAAPAAIEFAAAVVADSGHIGLIGGAGGRASAALPGVDLVAVRRTNACGVTAPGAAAAVGATTAAGRTVFVFGQRGTAPRHLQAALTLLAKAPDYARVLTHRVALAALPEALAAIADGRPLAGEPCVKAVVDCTRDDAAIELFGSPGPGAGP